MKEKKIGTFDISIRPYEDCCTIFVAKHPETRPKTSIIEAIGKIGTFSELKYILNWMEIHKNNIIEQHQFFLLKHIYKAICHLDNTPDEKYAKTFFDNYSKYMNSYIVN